MKLPTWFRFGHTQFHFHFSPGDRQQEESHWTGLRTGRDCPKGGPGRGSSGMWLPPSTSRQHRTRIQYTHLTGGKTEARGCQFLTQHHTGLPNLQPVTAAPHNPGPLRGQRGREQTALPRVSAKEESFLLLSYRFPLRPHRCVSPSKRNPPGYKGGDGKRHSQVRRPSNPSTEVVAGLKSFSGKTSQNRGLVWGWLRESCREARRGDGPTPQAHPEQSWMGTSPGGGSVPCPIFTSSSILMEPAK